MLESTTYKDKAVIRLSERFVPIKLNAEKEGLEIARRYGITAYPTVLFLSGSGQVQGRIAGYLPPKEFAAELLRIESAHRDLPYLVNRFRNNPRDAATAAKLAVIYAGREDVAHAESYLEKAEQASDGQKSTALAKAYNAVGDYYQLHRQFDRAIPLFRKGQDAATDMSDVTYARISVAACLFSQRKYRDAIPDLKAILALPSAPREMRDMAQQMLDFANKQPEHPAPDPHGSRPESPHDSPNK